MKKIDQFTDLYSVSKTLRFKAIPVGGTQDNIEIRRLLEEDECRAADYKRAKKLIDEYHKDYIDRTLSKLSNVQLVGLVDYYSLYKKTTKSDEDVEAMGKLEAAMREQISDSFIKSDEYKRIFSDKMIKEILPRFLKDEEDKNVIKSFVGFYTAFKGFEENRKNMYSPEEKSTAISYRCINENLPRFISNIAVFNRCKTVLEASTVDAINHNLLNDMNYLDEFFDIEAYPCFLSQKGIDSYNLLIGGMVKTDGEKVQGLNEYINLYNQQTKDKLPKLMPLYKQVLSDRENLSFYEEGYNSDSEMLEDLKKLFLSDALIMQAVENIKSLFDRITGYDKAGLYIKNDATLTKVANDVLGTWNAVASAWNAEYDLQNAGKKIKSIEEYEEKRRKAYKRIDSFSISDIEKLTNCEFSILEKIGEIISVQYETVKNGLADVAAIWIRDTTADDEKLSEEKIARIKLFLDSLKEFESLARVFGGSGKENGRDELFYGEYLPICDGIRSVDAVYNAVRNHVTKKPFSKDKFKLYFQNPQFLGGWDRDKESDYRVSLLRKNGLYYLAVIDKQDSKCLQKLSDDENDFYEKLNYKLLPGPNKMLPKVFFSKKGLDEYKPSSEILRLYEKGSFKKGKDFVLADCHKLIDFYKKSIASHPVWSQAYDFDFKPTQQYGDIAEFYREVEEQGYKVSFDKVSAKEIDALVECGKIYLFMLYNKDFSSYSHGTENLHTMYFKMLFDENNEGQIRLSGGAEMFMRRASLDKESLVVHPANMPIDNKNYDNPKKTSTFSYDICKDRRYSKDQYEVHIPIAINKVPHNNVRINSEVRRLLRSDDNPHVIGIDRGERNLLYVVVIDGKGNIVEQMSLNEIINQYKNVSIKTDYHGLLDRREKERAVARESWKSINNIKELKEGYVSQAVHKICELIIKYDAVIAMENLNMRFKEGRGKFEKQVYQKFEKMLIDKLNYLASKQANLYETGGILKGYQLTNKFESFRSMGNQNGYLFYIPAWDTSKIDPTTGFVNLLSTKNKSRAEAKQFVMNFDKIEYNPEEDMFIFSLDYNNFDRAEADYKKKWRIYTNGERIYNFRNPDKNGEYDADVIKLSSRFKQLFEKFGINIYEPDLRDSICKIDEKEFFVELLWLISLTVQMRNSITGRTDVDYLISPVKNNSGKFFDSREASESLPRDADANGAYNIARKVLWVITEFKKANVEELDKVSIAIKNAQWLEYAQTSESDGR